MIQLVSILSWFCAYRFNVCGQTCKELSYHVTNVRVGDVVFYAVMNTCSQAFHVFPRTSPGLTCLFEVLWTASHLHIDNQHCEMNIPWDHN